MATNSELMRHISVGFRAAIHPVREHLYAHRVLGRELLLLALSSIQKYTNRLVEDILGVSYKVCEGYNRSRDPIKTKLQQHE